MKLEKSPAGRVLIILYYVLFSTGDFFLIIFIILKTDSILGALGAGFALGIGVGVLGSELEFREHLKTRLGKFKRAGEPKRIVDFTR